MTTGGQINKAVANYRALLEKHAPQFFAEAVQTVLEQAKLAGEMFEIFRRRVEAVSNLVVRKVKVNRRYSPQGAIEATGRVQYTDRRVVDSMPKGEGDEVEVVFFKPDLSNRNGFISDDDLEKEFELRSLKPADPYTLAAVNEADPTFADEHPNATHWRDADDKWCYAAFDHWYAGRMVCVSRYGCGWSDRWRFAGLRK